MHIKNALPTSLQQHKINNLDYLGIKKFNEKPILY